jgi:hypothetical protein
MICSLRLGLSCSGISSLGDTSVLPTVDNLSVSASEFEHVLLVPLVDRFLHLINHLIDRDVIEMLFPKHLVLVTFRAAHQLQVLILSHEIFDAFDQVAAKIVGEVFALLAFLILRLIRIGGILVADFL